MHYHFGQFQVTDDQAVSEIIGTLILIALIAGAFAILAATLLSQTAAEKIPAATIIITNKSSAIFLYHGGGDPVPVSDLEVAVNGYTVPFSGAGSDGVWSAGETLTAVTSGIPQTVSVFYGSGASRIVLVSAAPEPW